MTSSEYLGGESVLLERGPQAVLFLHGFTSTTQALRPMGGILADAGFTVSMPLLPGHGTTPEDMAAHSHADWRKASFAAYDQLAEKYKNPAIIGFSMGGALGIQIAANRPVPVFVALAPALFLDDWRTFFLPILKYIMPWKKSIGNDVKGTRYQEKSYPRFHLKNVEDMLYLGKMAQKDLPSLKMPVLGIQSEIDHTISPRCLDYFIEHVGSEIKEMHRLKNSFHVLTLDNEFEQVAQWIVDFLKTHMPA
ncbi:alpha/beta fold hydrolase [bacterium]|nr:alpha/beta fold hydrolase [bacterium]